ncbi:MAG: hypothetical protein B6D46_01015 [Polyangiaceae bacterium UTPRO1]|jgi:hypothetical protein|nr:hypothetical protein [Myxococcales bacterium]OQY69099.1 MAG: hypothetical protein B6D46_01015 [Polyangiaceae bacterium UTPRO1]
MSTDDHSRPASRDDRRRRRPALLATIALTVLGRAAPALACPVCFAADERARASYLDTAVLLSILPLALFAGLALWLWRELDRGRSGPAEPEVAGLSGDRTIR